MSVQPVTLEGRHVRLEPLSLAHHADLCEAGLDEKLWRWIPGQVMTILRMRTCGCPECRAVFAVCANCDRGQRYCSPFCRETVRRGQRRAADRRYQQSERGRQFHRRRQCRYRERQAPAPVTDQGCQKINSPTTSASSGHPPLHNLRSVQPLDQSISSGSATEVISGTVARSGSSSKIYVFRRSPTGSGASQRQLREKLLDAARRREIDVVLVWRLDRVGPVRGGPAGNTPGTGPPRSRFRLPDRSPGPVDACWPGSPSAKGIFSASECAPAWIMPGRPARGWGDRQPWHSMYTMPASARLRSPADCGSGAPRYAVF